MRDEDGDDLHIPNAFFFQWKMKYSESFIIYVEVGTSDGMRRLVYDYKDTVNLGTGVYVHHGLGTAVMDGAWHSFTRNLQEDLNEAQPDVTITEVNSILVRGSGRFDDIKLRITNSFGDWTLYDYQIFEEATDFFNVWGSSESDVFVVGHLDWQKAAVHYDGNSWTLMNFPDNSGRLHDVWGTSGSDVFAVGSTGQIMHYDGASWSLMDDIASASTYCVISGTSSSNVFTSHWDGIGGGRLLHYDGNSWSYTGDHLDLRDIYNTSDSDLYAIGSIQGTSGFKGVYHYDGNSWSNVQILSGNGSGIWGSSNSDIYVVGYDIIKGRIWHYNGSAWTSVNVPELSDTLLFNVWGSSPSNVVAVGQHIYHFNGTSWNKIPTPVNSINWGVWCNDTDLIVSGKYYTNNRNHGVILHYKRNVDIQPAEITLSNK
ncbi:MAG: hypothetical protein GY751_13370 [Bacteroidetes bacterium]|nr:hypothetical protein [Bacteroidota bacterium]